MRDLLQKKREEVGVVPLRNIFFSFLFLGVFGYLERDGGEHLFPVWSGNGWAC